MKRREFITVIGGAAVWPASARAQQPERVRRIGVLLPGAAGDVEFQTRVGAFQQGLQQAGWTIGRNVRIDTRWATTDAAEIRRHAAELAALAPDVILAQGTSSVGPLLQATRAVPIVFVIVVDPVGAGFVASLARPGGNATGFMQFEYSLSAKWPELLKEIAPGVTRVAVLRDHTIASGIGQFGAIQSAAPSLRMEAIPINVRDAGEIELDIAAFARSSNGGVIVTSGPLAQNDSDLIVTLAARHRLPAISSGRQFVAGGGLISYGTNLAITSSPCPKSASAVLNSACFPPAVTMTSSPVVDAVVGLVALGRSLAADRDAGDRRVLVKFASIAWWAAAQIASGVEKSGSPAPKSITSTPPGGGDRRWPPPSWWATGDRLGAPRASCYFDSDASPFSRRRSSTTRGPGRATRRRARTLP